MFKIFKKSCPEKSIEYVICDPDNFFDILKKIKEEVENGNLELKDKPKNLIDTFGTGIPQELESFKVFGGIKTNIGFSDPKIILFTDSNTNEIKKTLEPIIKEIETKINSIDNDVNISIFFVVEDGIGYPRIYLIFNKNDLQLHFAYIEINYKKIKNLLDSLKNKNYTIKELTIDKVRAKVPKLKEVDGKFEVDGEEEKEVNVYFYKGNTQYNDKLRMKVWLISKNNDKFLLIGFYNLENKKDKTKFFFGAI